MPLALVLLCSPWVEYLTLGSVHLVLPATILVALAGLATLLAALKLRTSWLWPVLFMGLTLVSAASLPGYLAIRSRMGQPSAWPPSLRDWGLPGNPEAKATAPEFGGTALEAGLGKAPLPRLPRVVPLSADQETLVQALGMPDQFLVAMESGTGTRAEVWTWYRARGGDALLASAWKPRTFGFLNGRLQGESQARAVKVKTGPPAAPPDFDPSWTEDRARQLLGDPDLIVRKDSPVFGRVTVLNYRNQLVLTFRNGALCGAQNLVMEAAP